MKKSKKIAVAALAAGFVLAGASFATIPEHSSSTITDQFSVDEYLSDKGLQIEEDGIKLTPTSSRCQTFAETVCSIHKGTQSFWSKVFFGDRYGNCVKANKRGCGRTSAPAASL